jgi:GAF domain-containing protein
MGTTRTKPATTRAAGPVSTNGDSAKVQDALYRIADMASAASDMGEFYAAMHRIVGELMYADNFYIALYDEDDQTLNYPYYVDQVDEDLPDPEAWEPMGTGQARGMTAYVLRTGTPQLVTNERFHQLLDEGEIEHVGVDGEDWLGVPLRAEGKTIGVVVVQTYERGQHYSQQDKELFTYVGQHIASALSRARAIADTRRLLVETNQRAAELAVINSVQGGLAAQVDMQRMYELVGDKIQEIFDAQVVDIGILDAEAGKIRFPYAIERGVRFPDEPIPVMGIREHVLQTLEPVVINERNLERAAEFGQAAAIQGEVPKASLFAPLVVGSEATGVISLQNLDREYAFSESDVRLLTTLAASLSVALENARLIHETRQRAAELETVNSIGQALAAQLDLEALIDLVGERTRQAFNADIVYVALLDAARGMIDFPYYYEAGSRKPPDSMKYGEGWTSQILQSCEPLLINSEELRESFQEIALGTPTKSYLGVPILIAGAAIGVIAVQSITEDGRFGADDARLLATIAASVGAAIQNARLYRETRLRASEMSALVEVSRQISATLEADAVLHQIAERARELLDANTSAVYLAEPDGRFLARVVLGDSAEEIKAIAIVAGEGIIGDFARSAEAGFVNDVNADPRAIQIEGTAEEETERLMIAQLRHGEGVSGMTAVWRSGVSQPFVHENLDFLVGLSQQAAVAIANARLYADAQAARAEADRHRGELARFLPSTVAALMAEPGESPLLAAHRREITVIFCDLRGFTTFTQEAEPEEALEMLAAYQRLVGQLVLESGGTLEHYAGDGIMAFLNDPEPVANHPLVGVSMALEMQRGFVGLAEKWQRRGFELGLGIGLSTGYATVGRVGFEGYYLYAAIGSVANLAARLCAVAQPGQVVISGRTHSLVEGSVEAEPLGSVELKGFSRPVEAFAVAGLKPA